MSLRLLLLCALTGTPLLAASCEDRIEEFALLAHMDMTQEAAQLYDQLIDECHSNLRAAINEDPPAVSQQAQWLALGKDLYQRRRDGASQQAVSAFAEASIADIDSNALQGMGPDNMTRAIAGLGLDIAATELNNRGQLQQAQSVQELANQVRGDEKRWTPDNAMPGSNASHQPQIALPAIQQQINCNGDLSFLAPLLRQYRDPPFQEARQAILGASTPQMLSTARQLGQSKAETIQISRQQSAEYDRAAAEAAQTAQQTDGHGNRSIPMVINEQLPLDFHCEADSIHASAVCNFILMRWGSLASRTTAAVAEKCWN